MANTFSNTMPLLYDSGLAAGSLGDKDTIQVPFRCELRRTAITWEGTDANAVAAVVQFDITPRSGGTRDTAGAGQIKKTASLNEVGKYVYVEPTTKVTLYPGDLVTAEVTTAQGAALAFSAVLIVEEIPESLTNETGAKKTA